MAFATGAQAELAYMPELEGGWGTTPTADFLQLALGANYTGKAGDTVAIEESTDTNYLSNTDVVVLLVINARTVIIQHTEAAWATGATFAGISVIETGAGVGLGYDSELYWDYAEQEVQFTGETMSLDRTVIESAMIRSDRNIQFYAYGNKSAAGGINAEWVYDMFDDFVLAALEGLAWQKGTKFTAAALPSSVKVGDNITLEACTGDASYNGEHIIVHLDAARTEVTVDVPFVLTEAAGNFDIDGTDYAISAAAAGASYQIATNGTTSHPFSIERKLTDIEQFFLYKGMMVNTMTVNIAPNALTTIGFEFMGKKEEAAQTTSNFAGSGASVNSAWGDAPIDSFTGALMEGTGMTSSTGLSLVTAADFTITNNLNQLFVIGSNEVVGVIEGRCNVTGNMTVFVEDAVMYNKFVNGEESAIRFAIEEGDIDKTYNNMYIVDIPRVKYTGGTIQVGGEGELSNPMPFQALYSNDQGYTIRIIRSDAVD